MARGKKTPVRPRRGASGVQASSEAISSQPDRPSSAASLSTQPALLLSAGSQPTPANQPDATQPAASQPDATLAAASQPDVTQPTASQPPSEAVASTGEIDSETSDSRRSNLLSNWKNVVQETEEAVAKHEVDQYLEAALELIDDLDCFDILLWWKLNQFKYPVLAAIARDVLSIQVSTVASESAFSTGGRVVDCFRSSLTPKTVEGLICMQNWLLGNDIADNIDDCTIENYEFYEGVELEHESTATSKANVCPPPPSRAKAKGKCTAAGPIDV